jgi:hypothetical protein
MPGVVQAVEPDPEPPAVLVVVEASVAWVRAAGPEPIEGVSARRHLCTSALLDARRDLSPNQSGRVSHGGWLRYRTPLDLVAEIKCRLEDGF